MTLVQALVYFVKEAALNLLRSWRVSLLAVATIGVTVFIAGCFLLVWTNLSDVLREWRGQVRVIVYLEDAAGPAEAETLAGSVREAWVQSVEVVSPATAKARFAEAFPSLGQLVEGWGEEPLPYSIEISLLADRIEEVAFDRWVANLREHSSVTMVDDDRTWLRQLEAGARVLLGVGLTLGAVLALAAVFTIGSVIRLTAYLYRDEIAVMRLVGATEFFIRGPFYMEGLLQGTIGGVGAVGALAVVWFAFDPGQGTLVLDVIAAGFLGPAQQAVLVAIGSVSGLAGAVISLRGESV